MSDDELIGEGEGEDKNILSGFGIEEDDEVGAIVEPDETEEDELEATGMHIEGEEEPEDDSL
jgi:hypothetical protein